MGNQAGGAPVIMKIVQIVFGGFFVGLGVLMLVLMFRDGANDGGTGQAWLGPLALMGAGALSISHARKKPKKW